jgi:mRNA-degrading endonuclease RelE of RelBE toxin-antitoxin system
MHVDIHSHADEDLEKLWQTNAEAAAEVHAWLEVMEDDPQAIDKLTTHGNSGGSPNINIKSWKSAGTQLNLWRARILDTPATSYRVVYGYHWRTRQLCILAIVKKDEFDYDDHSSAIVQRVFNDWQELCW